MKCLHCQGDLVRGFSPFHIDRKGYHLILDRIPSWICRQCGEPLFETAAVESIQRLIRDIDKSAGKLEASA
jgi:YgiT-type zinc finger domain-containing protein